MLAAIATVLDTLYKAPCSIRPAAHRPPALLNYHYPPPESRLDAEAPVKDGPDHLVDALRYFFINRMRPQIAISRGTY